jgi:hypothetical protein
VNLIRKELLIISVFIILLSSALMGCISNGDEGWKTESVDDEYAVEQNTVLTVQNTNGPVKITNYKGDKVILNAEKKVKEDRKAELDDVEIVVNEGNKSISIETKHNKEDLDVTTTMTLEVPSFVNIESVSTSNGNLEVNDVIGDVNLSSSNGEIIVSDVDGYVNAYSSNGGIEIRDVIGIDDVITSNGFITVEVQNFRGDVKIQSSNGQLKVYINPSLNADISIITSNGEITLHEITLDLTTDEKTNKVGKLGAGGNKISINTSNGDIDIYKLK